MRVPCSTSNLGAGFDCIGLAFDRHLDVQYQPGDSATLRVERAGTLSSLTNGAGDDAVATAFASALRSRGVGQIAGVLRMTSEIPVGRGLGSSAAATIAGLLLAAVTLGEEPDRDRLLSVAAHIEGHPDNAAPALQGGLVCITADPAGEPRTLPLRLSPRIGFAYAAPALEISTAYARRVLPASVSHAVAVRALARVLALVQGLASGDAELLRTGFDDELHVPYRMALIPGAERAVLNGREAGAWAVTVSGSGSGLIAVCPVGSEATVAEAMGRAFDAQQGPVVCFPLQPDVTGAQVVRTS